MAANHRDLAGRTRPAPPRPPAASADPATAWIVGVWFVALYAAHLAGSLSPRGWAWGFDVYAFWPHRVFAGASVALALIVTFALLRPRDTSAPGAPLPAWAPVAVAAAFGAVCWLLRARHVLLGDGLAIVTEPPGFRLHPLEPLSALVAQWVRIVLPAPSSMDTAWRATALISTIAGAGFACVAVALAGELARLGRDDHPSAGTEAAFAIVLLAQGYTQVFFGYVENYALATLGAALYLLAALRVLRGAGSLLACGLALGLALALHLGAAAYLLSFLVPAIVALRRADGRSHAIRDLILLGLIGGIALAAVATTQAYNAAGQLGRTLLDVLRGDTSFRPEYRGSLEHLRDFLNGQALAGPFAALLFVPAAVRLARAESRSGSDAFLLVAGIATLAASGLAGDSNLGYARNWDLMAPYAFVMTAAVLGLLGSRMTSRSAPRGVLAAVVAMSLFHTAPWIALNHSLDRSLARFQTLPLGLGRVESTLGYWEVARGNDVAAERWYVRSLDLNPTNIRAHLGLASIYRDRGDAVGELLALRETVRLRPADARARWRLLDALVRTHAWGPAAGEAARFAAGHPNDPGIAIAYAVTLSLAGRGPDAERALEPATRFMAEDTSVARRIAEVRGAARDTVALGEIWTREFGVPDPRVP